MSVSSAFWQSWMSLQALMTNVVHRSACIAKNDFKTERSDRISLAVADMEKKMFLQAPMDSFSAFTSNSSGWR